METIREVAIITKLSGDCGFIHSFDRNVSLFFRARDFAGEIKPSLRVGDVVEFQLQYDPLSGKPSARNLAKRQPDEIVSEYRLIGRVLCVATGGDPQCGQIGFEFDGHYYFLPYEQTDSNTELEVNDQVSFNVSNGGAMPRAIRVTKVSLARYQGAVCALKHTYGFIERADNREEIFFHFSEVKQANELNVGDYVEFSLETKEDRTVAVAIVPLPVGSLFLEEVSQSTVRGTILRTIKGLHSLKDCVNASPLLGCVLTEPTLGVCLPYEFRQRDLVGDHTFYPGDIVIFNIAVDRRNGQQRATNIQLLSETFFVQNENRLRGHVISALGDYGFIRCAETEGKLLYRMSEKMDRSWSPAAGDEVEFTSDTEPPCNRIVAVRIRHVPNDAVNNHLDTNIFNGIILRTPSIATGLLKERKNIDDETDRVLGLISCMQSTREGETEVAYEMDSLRDPRRVPLIGESVQFNIITNSVTGKEMAVNIKVTCRTEEIRHEQGFIAAVKDAFGFIETAQHDREVFFHCTSFRGTFSSLNIGDEVEYDTVRKHGRVSAYNISVLPRGTVNPEKVDEDNAIYHGKIVRPLRIVNPQQDVYAGLVQLGIEDDNNPQLFEYGVTGLADVTDFLQANDTVTFKLATVIATGQRRATCVAGLRKPLRAIISCVKEHHGYGFLNYVVPNCPSRKLFFHTSEVKNRETVRAGDVVEFVLIQNQKNGRYSACALQKVSSSASASACGSLLSTPTATSNAAARDD